jgi:hypothetical protein
MTGSGAAGGKQASQRQRQQQRADAGSARAAKNWKRALAAVHRGESPLDAHTSSPQEAAQLFGANAANSAPSILEG